MKFSTQREIDKEARKRTEELQEMLRDTAKKMFDDQSAWLDTVMKDILPPHLYEAGRHNDCLEEIGEYLKKHKFSIVHIPDSYSIRVMRDGHIHAEFLAKLTLDGEEIEIRPTMPGLN